MGKKNIAKEKNAKANYNARHSAEIEKYNYIFTENLKLAREAKTRELTPEELTERDKLRRIYIDSVKANLVGQLENTYIVRPDGTKEKVKHK